MSITWTIMQPFLPIFFYHEARLLANLTKDVRALFKDFEMKYFYICIYNSSRKNILEKQTDYVLISMVLFLYAGLGSYTKYPCDYDEHRAIQQIQ